MYVSIATTIVMIVMIISTSLPTYLPTYLPTHLPTYLLCPSDMMNEIFTAVRKGGRISVVGVYIGYANHFNIGCFMEKVCR